MLGRRVCCTSLIERPRCSVGGLVGVSPTAAFDGVAVHPPPSIPLPDCDRETKKKTHRTNNNVRRSAGFVLTAAVEVTALVGRVPVFAVEGVETGVVVAEVVCERCRATGHHPVSHATSSDANQRSACIPGVTAGVRAPLSVGLALVATLGRACGVRKPYNYPRGTPAISNPLA